MAFDMYLDGKNEKIHYSEEDFFMIITKEDGFPNLEWLWNEFYNGPKIDGQRAKLIAEELETAKINKRIKSRHSLVKFIDRVHPFFGKAGTLNKGIKCISDQAIAKTHNKFVNRTFFATLRFAVASPLYRKTPLHKNKLYNKLYKII